MIPTFDALTLQITTECNLRCKYCYQDRPKSGDTGCMPLSLVQKTLTGLVNYHKDHGIRTGIDITFHGGEPLKAGVRYFRDLLNYIDSLSKSENISIRKNIQTNLTLLNVDFCKIFSKHHVVIGTSVDGPAEIHDRNRGKGTHQCVMNSIALAREFNLDVGAIAVITKDKLRCAKEIYDFFKSIRMNFKTNPVFYNKGNGIGKDDLVVSGMEFAEFSCELFGLWYDDTPGVMIDNFVDLMWVILRGGSHGDCTGSNCANRQVTVMRNGDVTPCGRTSTDAFFTLGNSWIDDFSRIKSSEKFNLMVNRVPDRIDECCRCDLRTLCFSGCMFEAYDKFNTIYAPEGNCEAFRSVCTCIRNRMLRDLTCSN
jgi:uncharacterized protein